jgi:hypothetical protein
MVLVSMMAIAFLETMVSISYSLYTSFNFVTI